MEVELGVRRGWWRPGLKMSWLLGSVGDLDSSSLAEKLRTTHTVINYGQKKTNEKAVNKDSIDNRD